LGGAFSTETAETMRPFGKTSLFPSSTIFPNVW
jgi:hypothetical protein